MTGTTTERHMCRNPRCRSRLPASVSNPREAFCARGCHTQFYRKRCLVCERDIERKTEARQLCGRPKCRSQFRSLQAHFMMGRYHASTPAPNASRKPIKTRISSPLKGGRGWRQVAGPTVDMRLATIGAEGAVKHADKVNRRHCSDVGAAALIQRHHAPVNIVGGFKFPDAPEIEIAPIGNVSSPMWVPALADVGSRDDPLAIPEFLRRPMQAATINLNEEYPTERHQPDSEHRFRRNPRRHVSAAAGIDLDQQDRRIRRADDRGRRVSAEGRLGSLCPRGRVMARKGYTGLKRAIDYLLHTPGSYLRKMHGRSGAPREHWLFPDGGQVTEKDALAIIARPDIVVRDRGLLDDCPQSWGVLQQGRALSADASWAVAPRARAPT